MPKPKKGEHRICALDDLDDGSGKSIKAGVDLAVFRIGEEVFAIKNACGHKGEALHDGSLDATKKTIRCRWHYHAFDLASGKNAGKKRTRVASYPVEIREGEVFARLKDD